MIVCDDAHVYQVQKQLGDCIRLLDHYEWLINSFVLDFFLDSHWSHLPASWQPTLTSIPPAQLAAWLDPEATPAYTSPWPLSLLALKQAIGACSLPRKPVKDLQQLKSFLADGKRHSKVITEGCPKSVEPNGSSQITEGSDGIIKSNQTSVEQAASEYNDSWMFEPELLSAAAGCHSGLRHVFRKHVKPKKQHEMCRLARLIDSVGKSQEFERVLDIGAGVGHLSRYLSYNYRLQVACVDGDGQLTGSAKKFDQELEATVAKLKSRNVSTQMEDDIHPLSMRGPVHVTAVLAPDMDLPKFHALLADKFHLGDGAELKYGLVGLHTCGDLGPTILHLFHQDSGAGAVVSVGCCYMRLKEHYPMSRYVKAFEWGGLSYVSEELACHAIETYTERLAQPGENEKLKVHCYRAVLEHLLVTTRSPKYRHTILKTVPKAHTLSFPVYVGRATQKLVAEAGLEPFTEEELTCPEVEKRLARWWEVVTFYTLRLAMAPVIETVILLDRQLFLFENGHNSIMLPLFDPLLSPRNQVIVAVKN